MIVDSRKEALEVCGPAVEGTCSLPLHQGSSFTVHACHPCGALYAHWACRMFSGPGD